ncbi:hypothetical protein [Bradyrhizobium cosmicum]|uniref:Uncharacterized protein n=1 Tax=Bradyrhizobium cosmicum TaxID=1404864 RepID=A0AAI8QBU7_9BRAD|nr:hypothetical protein [Bradyrhizobium cosmicum]BAL75968.1 hypothetical protein S23_27560 [Bradyrhizobium cosmicum]
MGGQGEDNGAAVKRIGAVLAVASLAGCAPSQQALLASGGSSDFKAMQWVADEYGSGEPDAMVQVPVDGQEKPFKVFVSKKSQRIMVQNGLNSEIAGAAFTRGLTAGIANSGPPDRRPYEEAARIYLAGLHGEGACRLTIFSPVTHIGYDWTYDCLPPARSKR